MSTTVEKQTPLNQSNTMKLIITNGQTGMATLHDSVELARIARSYAKEHGKFIGFHVSIQDGAPTGATVSLCADYQKPDGLRGQVSIAI